MIVNRLLIAYVIPAPSCIEQLRPAKDALGLTHKALQQAKLDGRQFKHFPITFNTVAIRVEQKATSA
jgi:hypothetical protein